MKRTTIMKFNKIGEDYETIVTKDATPRDVEIALSVAIMDLVAREKALGNNIKEETILNAIKGWIKCIKQDQ